MAKPQHIHVQAAVICCSLLCLSVHAIAAPPQIISNATTWRVSELTFRTSKTYANPFTDVEVNAVFTGPSGVVIHRPAFWDGDNVWRVRFAPPAAGVWQACLSASDTANPDFQATAVVTATAYTGGLPIYRRGFLKGRTGHYLTYADGTPFFYMADEMAGIDNAFLDKSNKTDWQTTSRLPPPRHASSQIYSIIERRVQQKFTAVSYWFARRWVPGQTGTMPDLKRFQTFVDPVMQFTADRGLVTLMTVAYAHDKVKNGQNNLDVQGMPRMAWYFVARYGAYPVIWTYDEPDVWRYEDGTFCLPVAPGKYAGPAHPDMENIDYWGTIFALTASLDGYHQPIGPWYGQAAVHPGHPHMGPPPIYPEYYLKSDWLTMCIPHCGHTSSTRPDFQEKDRRSQPMAMYQFYYDRYPDVPFIDAGGGNYERIFPAHIDDYIIRRTAWRAIQCGSAGFGYGAQGIWTMQWDTTTYKPGFYANIPWYRGIDFPGGQQMCYLTEFYTAIPWHTLVPLNGAKSIADWNMAIESETETLPLVSADPKRDWVVIYFPRRFATAGSTAAGTLHGLPAGARYEAQWYDPRSGKYIVAGLLTSHDESVTIPQKPGGDKEDWVLRLHARAP
jgi:hypothetical protein